MFPADRAPTGVRGLDEMLGGGIPKGRVVLILGSPGSGKTILCAQFLYTGIVDCGENGVYVSFDEGKPQFYREMAKLGWDFAALEGAGKFAFVDASPIRSLPGEVKIGGMTIGKRDFSLLSVIQAIRNHAASISAQRIVLDSMSQLTFQYPDPVERRTAVLDLIDALADLGATCLLTSELVAVGMRRKMQFEEYLVHGVIILQTMRVGKAYGRVIQVEKMRETWIDEQPRPYQITERGIEVYPRETVF